MMIGKWLVIRNNEDDDDLFLVGWVEEPIDEAHILVRIIPKNNRPAYSLIYAIDELTGSDNCIVFPDQDALNVWLSAWKDDPDEPLEKQDRSISEEE
jgi:hypothetical protein